MVRSTSDQYRMTRTRFILPPETKINKIDKMYETIGFKTLTIKQ